MGRGGGGRPFWEKNIVPIFTPKIISPSKNTFWLQSSCIKTFSKNSVMKKLFRLWVKNLSISRSLMLKCMYQFMPNIHTEPNIMKILRVPHYPQYFHWTWIISRWLHNIYITLSPISTKQYFSRDLVCTYNVNSLLGWPVRLRILPDWRIATTK